MGFRKDENHTQFSPISGDLYVRIYRDDDEVADYPKIVLF